MADGAGPGDYRTEVERVVPASDVIGVSIHGGDSFLRLEVRRGSVVSVPGYRDEPFLEFAADGTVRENIASYTHLLSRSRYGSELPADWDETAAPQWRIVSTNGAYAWHDHRIHWMSDVRPPGRRPGETILRATVPLVVDGVPVAIEVRSLWLRAPSTVPSRTGVAVGAVVGLGTLGLLGRRRARVRHLLLTIAAVVVGWRQFASLPSDTGPAAAWWLVPLLAALAAAVAVVVAVVAPVMAPVVGPGASLRPPLGRLSAVAALAVSAVLLAWWAWPRRAGWDSAFVPTDLPGWSDRLVSAAALAGGCVVAAGAVATLVAVVVAPERALRPELTSAR